MKTRPERVVGIAVLAAAWVLAAAGQAAGGKGMAPRLFLSSRGPIPVVAPVSGEVVREIDDPHSGDHWLLMRDEGHPGGPGRMVLVAGLERESLRDGARVAQPAGFAALDRIAVRPVIHTGDRLIVEESTPVVEARLEGVALGPAASGVPFNVRLKVGGNVVRAVALGPGRAVFAAEAGGRP
jgi:hypothetical protein